jgi:hypothetical protein
MEFNADALKDHLIFLDRLGPPKKVLSEEFGLTMGMCACDKRVMLTEFEVLNSSLSPVVDNVCPGCRHATKGMAILACPRCRAVIARIPAHKDKSGFEFKEGKIYHVDCCAVCEYEMIAVRGEPTFILEMLHYFKQRNMLIPDQWKNRTYGKPLLLGA